MPQSAACAETGDRRARDSRTATRLARLPPAAAVPAGRESATIAAIDVPDISSITTAPGSAFVLGAIVAASLVGLSHPAMVERCLFRPYWFWRRREFATPITSAFVHADLGHLFFNSFTFWAFGFGLEREIGTPRFVWLYLFGIFASAAGTYLEHRSEPGYRTLGASGAILAVLFASIVYRPDARLFILPIPIPIPAPLFAFGFLAYSWVASRRRSSGVNHDAHLAGAIAGVAFVAITDPAALARALQFVFGR
jgi:membrane associated rhomboid family serine protease